MKEIPFDTLECENLALYDIGETTKYRKWLVFYHFEDENRSPWYESIAQGACKRLEGIYSEKMVNIIAADYSGAVVLLSPSIDSFDEAVKLARSIKDGEHPDMELYNEMVDEYTDEWWGDLDFEDRLEAILEAGEDPAIAFKFNPDCPLEVRRQHEIYLNGG